MEEALNTEAGQRAVLDFAGFPAASQVPAVGARVVREKPKPVRPEARPTTEHPLDPGKCVILVPISGFIHPGCERALQELERRGHPVRRVGGYTYGWEDSGLEHERTGSFTLHLGEKPPTHSQPRAASL